MWKFRVMNAVRTKSPRACGRADHRMLTPRPKSLSVVHITPTRSPDRNLEELLIFQRRDGRRRVTIRSGGKGTRARPRPRFKTHFKMISSRTRRGTAIEQPRGDGGRFRVGLANLYLTGNDKQDGLYKNRRACIMLSTK